MFIKNSIAVSIILLLFHESLFSISLVYNMRVRRSFNVPSVFEQKGAWYALSLVPIYFSRTSTFVSPQLNAPVFEDRRSGGSLINFRYIPSKYWWAEVTTGIEHDHGNFSGADVFSAGRTGFDDLVFTAGRRFFLSKKTQVVGYGLLGIPTKWSVSLDDRFGPLVGSRFYNLGVGAEASYNFIDTLKQSATLFAQGRFIHGFDRRWFPVLPEDATIVPGNFSDILTGVQYRYGLTAIQIGYDATIFSNQGVESARGTTTTDAFVRNSWFVTANHGILEGLFDKPSVVGAGVSMSNTKKFDAHTLTMWLNFTQLF